MEPFNALAEPTRRGILELLAAKGRLSASEISSRFEATPSAISQHLKVLREAELVRMERHAQQRIYEVNPQAIVAIAQWARNMNRSLDRLEALVEERKLTKKIPPVPGGPDERKH